jgi:hypothetical protein
MKLLTALLLAFFLFTSFLFSQNTFRLGFTGAYPDKYNFVSNDWGWYGELKMNTWSGWWVGDAEANTVMNSLGTNNLYGLFQPDSLRWAGYGRVVILQAEDISDRFSYYNHHGLGSNFQDNTQFGDGQYVRRYIANPSGPYTGFMVLDSAKENGIQSVNNFGCDPKIQVTFPGDGSPGGNGYVNTYYIKPKIRIDSTYADSNKNVLRIIVKAFNGDTVLNRILTTSDFLDNSNNYNGRYIEDFPARNLFVRGDSLNRGRPERRFDQGVLPGCQVDYQIYWYGEVSVWIDYVKVMDEAAKRLLYDEDIQLALQRKMERLSAFENTYGEVVKGFYMEEVDYYNIECLKYLNEMLYGWAGNDADYKMIGLINYYSFRAPLKNYYLTDYEDYVDNVQPPVFMFVSYPFEGPHGFHRPKLPKNLTYSFQTYYPSVIEDQITDDDYGYPSYEDTKENYNTFLQTECWDLYHQYYDTLSALCQSKGLNFHLVPQVHTWKDPSVRHQSHREPMNSEISALMNIGICNGVKGIMPFQYQSGYSYNAPLSRGGNGVNQVYSAPDPDGYSYSFGMTDFSTDTLWGHKKRTMNFYGEDKWGYVTDLYEKMKTWGPVLYSSTNTQGFSVHDQNAAHEFISDILSIDPTKPLGVQNPCINDYQTSGYLGGPYFDCPEERYWEMGFFSTTETNTKYFMMVNRRCVPKAGNDSGDFRVLKIKFDANDFLVYNSWYISEVGGTSLTGGVTFDKSSNIYVDLGSSNGGMGWFKPGEGKLFKIVPVPVKGGTLVADEVISGESFTCEAPVYNNGFNITIGANTTIHFNDSSKFVMNGGVFTGGDQNTSAPQNITSDAVPGGSWRGHSFTNCEVKIYGATFTGLANDTTYAVNIIDCPVVDIRNCTFNTNSSLKGGVNAICFDNPFIAINNIYIGSNTFNSAGSTIPTLNVSSYAGVTTPLIIENNTFTEGNTAIFLSGVIGGAIKGNTITDNYIGINALTSSIDIVQNTISSTVNGSMGIFAAGGSELKLNSSGAFTLGGLNSISNEGTGTNNINVDGSYFLLEGGENIFNISSNQSSYHLYGYFPMFTAVTTEETNNCFKVDGSPVDPPINMVTSGYQGTQITFNFNPYLSGCEIPDGGDGLAINLGDGIYDTIYSGGSGSGGSQKEILPLTKGEYPQGQGVYDKQTTPSGYAGHPSLVRRGAYVAPFAKEKYDSVCVLMRYRNYTQAKTKCLDLVNTYPDSIQSIFAVSKLFLATVASDTTYNAANTLKIFYENLILNYPNSTSLVKRANYYILKCKVRMREYSQALLGFQQIINQSPYSYEGLIARWDYMATSLLVQGQGGAYSSIDNEQLTMNNYEIDGNDDDKRPFTKEQRQDIRKSINTAIEISKNDDEVKIKKLEEKSELGDVNASKELTQMKSLKQVVKTEKPKSITQHVRIVSEDIRKVFGSNTSSKGNEPKNIPLVFRISQNYPNPFNPVTKINYDLPKDSKVKIVIYDILGREVKRLVNNELKTAGSYIVDFNASNYASGVYFYRIEAEEPNGNKFVDSKKMVLIK